MSNLPIRTRRDFLTHGLGLIGVSTVLPEFLIRSAMAAPSTGGGPQVAVVIEMSGGNDTLSTLIPYAHKAYVEGRRTTRIPESEILKLDDELGFHPRLKGFKELLDEGRLAILPGVGYPHPNYSHFTSMDIWHVADERASSAATSRRTAAKAPTTAMRGQCSSLVPRSSRRAEQLSQPGGHPPGAQWGAEAQRGFSRSLFHRAGKVAWRSRRADPGSLPRSGHHLK